MCTSTAETQPTREFRLWLFSQLLQTLRCHSPGKTPAPALNLTYNPGKHSLAVGLIQPISPLAFNRELGLIFTHAPRIQNREISARGCSWALPFLS